jgi:hypothetical protein
MTMHLEGPWLSLGGKRKGKVKFRNAEEAKRARELEQSWSDLLKRQGIEAEEKKRIKALKAPTLTYKLSAPPGRETQKIKSLSTPGGSTAAVHKVYTGDKILGITIVHKSCLQPVFNQQEAIDAANMRR